MLPLLPDTGCCPLVFPVLCIEHSRGSFDEGAEGSTRHPLTDFLIAGPFDDEHALFVEVGRGSVDPDNGWRQRRLSPEVPPAALSASETKSVSDHADAEPFIAKIGSRPVNHVDRAVLS